MYKSNKTTHHDLEEVNKKRVSKISNHIGNYFLSIIFKKGNWKLLYSIKINIK